jgi:choice-of-anchor A domain-containing protein
MNALVRGLVLVGIGVLASGGSVAQAGMLFSFDVAVGGNHDFNGGQIHGRTLIAGNASGNGGTVGTELLWNPSGDTYTLGGNLTTGLNAQQGSVRVGGTNNKKYLNLNGGGTVKSLAGFDAVDLTNPDNLRAALQTASDHFAGLTASSHYVRNGNTLTFSAVPGADGVAVFDVELADLNDQNLGYFLELNGASSVVFNVTGKGTLTQLGNFQTGFQKNGSQILWNFHSLREDLTLVNREWYGSILLPQASLTNRSPINGGVYVGGDFNQHADVKQAGYGGPPILSPEPPPAWGAPPAPEKTPDIEDRPGTGDAPDVATVPEPSTILVFAVGGLIFAGQQWRKRRLPSIAGA